MLLVIICKLFRWAVGITYVLSWVVQTYILSNIMLWWRSGYQCLKLLYHSVLWFGCLLESVYQLDALQIVILRIHLMNHCWWWLTYAVFLVRTVSLLHNLLVIHVIGFGSILTLYLPGMEGSPVFSEHACLTGVLIRPLRQQTSGAEIQVVPWMRSPLGPCLDSLIWAYPLI